MMLDHCGYPQSKPYDDLSMEQTDVTVGLHTVMKSDVDCSQNRKE